MRPPILLSTLVLAFAACTSSVEGNGAENPDAAATVTPDFPDAAPQVVLPDAEPVVQPCIEGDQRVTNPDDGTCYMLLNGLTNWTGAQAACITLGANLVSIDTAEEQVIVGGLATLYPAGEPDLWIGASDSTIEGTFVWVNQDPLVYSNWRAGEPNNNGPDGTDEDCAIIEGDAATEWDDRPCSRLSPAICER